MTTSDICIIICLIFASCAPQKQLYSDMCTLDGSIDTTYNISLTYAKYKAQGLNQQSLLSKTIYPSCNIRIDENRVKGLFIQEYRYSLKRNGVVLCQGINQNLPYSLEFRNVIKNAQVGDVIVIDNIVADHSNLTSKLTFNPLVIPIIE